MNIVNLENQIVELYKSYPIKTIRIILKESNINLDVYKISSILKSKGVRVTQKKPIYTVNENFFEKIDTPEKAQILGMIFTDGNIFANRLKIKLVETDRPYLEWIKKEMEFTGPIYTNKNMPPRENAATLVINNQKLINDLANLGCIPNKSLVLNFPTKIPDSLIKYFILGCFEGDGCLAKSKKGKNFSFSICGTKNMCESIKFCLKKLLNINAGLSCQIKNRKNKLYYVRLHRRYDLLVLLDWLYLDSVFKMNRKYQKYLEYINLLKTTYRYIWIIEDPTGNLHKTSSLHGFTVKNLKKRPVLKQLIGKRKGDPTVWRVKEKVPTSIYDIFTKFRDI